MDSIINWANGVWQQFATWVSHELQWLVAWCYTHALASLGTLILFVIVSIVIFSLIDDTTPVPPYNQPRNPQ